MNIRRRHASMAEQSDPPRWQVQVVLNRPIIENRSKAVPMGSGTRLSRICSMPFPPTVAFKKFLSLGNKTLRDAYMSHSKRCLQGISRDTPTKGQDVIFNSWDHFHHFVSNGHLHPFRPMGHLGPASHFTHAEGFPGDHGGLPWGRVLPQLKSGRLATGNIYFGSNALVATG
jgi:hypothetical protein